MNLSGDMAVKLTIGAGLGLLALYVISKLSGAAGSAARAVVDVVETKLNPASPENIIYANVVTPIVQATTGDKDAALGTKIYDWTHPDPFKATPEQEWSEWNPN